MTVFAMASVDNAILANAGGTPAIPEGAVRIATVTIETSHEPPLATHRDLMYRLPSVRCATPILAPADSDGGLTMRKRLKRRTLLLKSGEPAEAPRHG